MHFAAMSSKNLKHVDLHAKLIFHLQTEFSVPLYFFFVLHGRGIKKFFFFTFHIFQVHKRRFLCACIENWLAYSQKASRSLRKCRSTERGEQQLGRDWWRAFGYQLFCFVLWQWTWTFDYWDCNLFLTDIKNKWNIFKGDKS